MSVDSLPETEKRTILITGCSSGIGKTTARYLGERGYRVFATARHPDDVRSLAQEGYESLQLDLDDPDTIRHAVSEILDRTNGHLYALFNNGAYGQPGAVEDLSRDTLRRQFETNLFGTQELTNQVIPVMRKQGYGRIIQNSSILGMVSFAYRGAYNASKFALEALSDTLRLELRGSGIHVSLIEPGPIKSRFRHNAYKAFKENIHSHDSVHREVYQAVERRLSKKGTAVPFTLEADAVAEKVWHALESRRPKIRYYVTVPTYAFAAFRHILSYRAMDRLVSLLSDRPDKSR